MNASFLRLSVGMPAAPWRLLSLVAGLTKIRISLLATVSAATGYLVCSKALDAGAATACSGVLLLAMGACAVNQVQDRDYDARMERTRSRPIPAGEIRPAHALAAALALIAAGTAVLLRYHSGAAAVVGLSAVAWYNGVYTYAKRVWSFAAVPGALTGALPPVAGWAAAGGDPLDARILALAFFFFIWQVPHFWLLLFGCGDEYEPAGFPSPVKSLDRRRLAGLTSVWMLAAVASGLLLPLYGLTSSPWAAVGLLACGVWPVRRDLRLLRSDPEPRFFRTAFRTINLYALCVMFLLAADALIF